MSETQEQETSPEEQARLKKEYADRLFVGMVRRLALQKRVPATCLERGWPTDDDFTAALACVVVTFALNNPGEVIKRPASADAIQGWPEGASCADLFGSLSLGALLQDPPVVDQAD